MAEFVEEMQERLLPEYELMQKFNICTPQQLRDCIHKRKRFQTRITKNNKTMTDFLDFIIFERKVHKWVCEKEKLLGKKLYGLKSLIAKRIVKLYRQGLRSFPHEERLWLNYIHFSKKSVPHEVASVYERMITYFGDKEKLWCDAALWTYEYSGNIQKVKEIFYRALLRHPGSQIINISFFDILLADAAKLSTERNLDSNTKSEQEFGLEMLELTYSTGCKKHITDLNFYICLLERCEMADYSTLTIKLQKQIIEDLMESCAIQEELWDFLGQRELRGFSTTDLQNCKNWQSRTEEQRIELCCKVYETGVETLQTMKIMELYIDAMMKLNQNAKSELPLKRKRLAMAFQKGYEKNLINDDHLIVYLRMLLSSDKGCELAKNILENSVPSRNSVDLYDLWISAYIIEKNGEKIYEIFIRAHQEFHNKQLASIWKKVLNFYEMQGNSEHLKKIQELYTIT